MTKRTSLSQAKSFVQHERKKGVKDENIMRSLLNAGWKAEEITKALNNPDLPEHIVKRNEHRFHLEFAESLKAIPLNAWIIGIISTIWLLLFFKENAFLLFLILIPITAVCMAFLFLYHHYKKEWMIRICLMLNAGIFAFALFTLYTWLVSFAWRPMAEQWLLFSLYPGLIITFFAQEFAYHYWLGTHDDHTLHQRVKRALSYSTITLIFTFVALAISGMIFISSLQDVQFRTQEKFAQLEDQLILETDQGVLPVYQELLLELNGLEPAKPERIPAGIEALVKILTFQDMSPYIASVGQYTREGTIYSATASLNLYLMRQEFDRLKIMQQSRQYYDNASDEEDHLLKLRQGNARLSSAIEELPEIEQDDSGTGSGVLDIFAACINREDYFSHQRWFYRSQRTMSSMTSQRFWCSSKSVIAFVSEMDQLGEEVTAFRKSVKDHPRWSKTINERVESTLVRQEVKRHFLQEELERRVGWMNTDFSIREAWDYDAAYRSSPPSEDQEMFAFEHWEDAYFGPKMCIFLPPEQREQCAARWGPLYRDKMLCGLLEKGDWCDTQIVEEEIALLSS